ncbi:MAG: hypothetical protein AABZ75_01895 [candidate division NC10 bacterium]
MAPRHPTSRRVVLVLGDGIGGAILEKDRGVPPDRGGQVGTREMREAIIGAS